MKRFLRLLGLAGLAAGSTVFAQPTTEDFTTDQNTWQAISNAFVPKGNGTTTIDGRLNYVVTTATVDDAAGRYWVPSVGSNLSDWVVQIEVNISTLSLANNQYTNLQIGAAFNGHSFLNSIDWYKDNVGALFKGFEAYNDSSTVGSRFTSNLGSTTLKLAYLTADGGTLIAAFYDGTYIGNDYDLGSGYRAYAVTTGVLSAWSMTSGGTFDIILIGGSGDNDDAAPGPAIAAGTAYFDNFASSGLQARAVPEPSTYAAIAGLLALGFALYRRRH